MIITRKKKLIATFFLAIFTAQLLLPLHVYALTSGPSQPEMQKFESAGASDLVDLFTGDMKYNIPLMDVEGYPVNLSYNSGTGMEDEASWVGTGWTLNPGAVNRTMRGLPDDFDGSKGINSDVIEKEYSRKDFKKISASVIVKPSLFGWEIGRTSFRANIYKDNYYGIGASIGGGVDFSLSTNTRTPLTAGLDININSDTRSGVNIFPNISLETQHTFNNELLSKSGLSGGLLYNTRGGLKETSLRTSFSSTKIAENEKFSLSGNFSATHYFGQSYTPSINMNTTNRGFTFNIDGGIQIFAVYAGLGGEGSYYEEKNTQSRIKVPAFGYMNYLKGRGNLHALLDFNREKDGVFLPDAPSISSPVATHDFFTATSQANLGQFRGYYGSDYVVFDNRHTNISDNTSAGITVGGGVGFKSGFRISNTSGAAESQKWVEGNEFLNVAEPGFTSYEEPVAFRRVGEPTRADKNAGYLTAIGGSDARKINITSGPVALAQFKDRNNTLTPISSVLKKTTREGRNAMFSYLDAVQAGKYGLDQLINGQIKRTTAYRKDHHISEITITDNTGQRMVYGIPVYNILQEEVSFAINKPSESDYQIAKKTGLVSYTSADASTANRNGRDWSFSKEIMPAYATSFLLTGILSPDYVDKKSDGITDDDAGTAIRFGYVKKENYEWRAPYQLNKANYNEGNISDPKDDKASYVYGQREIWYLNKIEGKTMVAIFVTSDRQDGLGVAGRNGGQQTNSSRLQKLDKIHLYSKADYIKNGHQATPIKTVHFEYDYSLYPNVPNNSGAAINKSGITVDMNSVDNVNKEKGKLTLKRIYFTFGRSNRGASNPYDFNYDFQMIKTAAGITLPSSSPFPEPWEINDWYSERQTDRWGSYKQSFYNNVNHSLDNAEFPYTIQHDDATIYNEKSLNDRLVSKWQLKQIITPSNSVITIEYESDDYSFVQNRRAMQMCYVKGVNTDGGLINSNALIVQLPVEVTDVNDFKKKYLQQADGSFLKNIFFKMFIDLDNRGHSEFVHGYAEIDEGRAFALYNNKEVLIPVKPVQGYNPIARAAWQQLRTDLPQYAYESYDNSEIGDVKAAIRSLITSIGNLREIAIPFEKRAKSKDFANTVDFNKSMVRLCSPGYKDENNQLLHNTKMGGGSRVKKISISDQWAEMSGVDGAKTAVYGQVYEYIQTDNTGKTQSSGVAAYEPQIGNEENPFHEPITFVDKVFWGNDRYHFIEKPYCETFFPAAAVGYSRVVVTAFGNDYGSGQASLYPYTGKVVSEFYTAKDFPTLVENLSLDKKNYENSMILKLFTCTYINRVANSQGFKIELNDMHGKPKAVKVYNSGGDIVSSSEYFYKVKDQHAQEKELDNHVDVIDKTGTLTSNVPLATDIDLITDVRQNKNETIGKGIGTYGGGFPLVFFWASFGAVNVSASISKESYHSVSTVKVINRYGILHRTVTMQNGSTIEAENLVWDGETGEVVLSRTQNEFDKYTYAFSYPGYMAYEGMAGAYINQNIVIDGMAVGANGNVNTYSSYLFPGDELINLNASQKVWVIRSNDNALHIIDKNGDFVNTSGTYMIMRSGRRNMLSASVGSVIMMTDPRVNGRINLESGRRILDSKAAIFKEEWGLPVSNLFNASDCGQLRPANETDTTYSIQVSGDKLEILSTLSPATLSRSLPISSCNCDCIKVFFNYLIKTNQLFITQSANITVGQLITQMKVAGYNPGNCPILDNNRNRLFYALTTNSVSSTYTARIGSCQISLRSDNNQPVSFNELKAEECIADGTIRFTSTNTQFITRTFNTNCSYTVLTNSNGLTTITSPASTIAGSYFTNMSGIQQDMRYSGFRIDEVAGIPANAMIQSAQLYLYAVPTGFNPPAQPFAHSTNTAWNFMSFEVGSVGINNEAVACGQKIGLWRSPMRSTNITGNFSDAIVDMTSWLSRVRVGDLSTTLRYTVWPAHGVLQSDVNLSTYSAYASENYPDVTKRPKLVVNYTITTGTGQSATLSIDECPDCVDPLGEILNPYYAGVLGNWRPYTSYVYTVNREQKAGNAHQQDGTDIRNLGYYSSYNPFWSFTNNGLVNGVSSSTLDPDVPDTRWVWNEQSVYYDQKGNPIEGRDALNRYSSSLFGYQQSVATAIASNARRNEIAFDGFEDYNFQLSSVPQPCPLTNHFDFGLTNVNGIWSSGLHKIVSGISHTGKYSLQLNGQMNITKNLGNANPLFNVLGFDNTGRYLLLNNDVAKGFAPLANKKYLISFWVNDHSSMLTDKVQHLAITINGQSINLNEITVPVVEGWKRLEIPVTIPDQFALSLTTSTAIEIDDFRILPFDGQLASYVYDESTMRLVAQLDENNFATLYEYDEEGTPIRVKKETERGIMTLKENRQALRKRN